MPGSNPGQQQHSANPQQRGITIDAKQVRRAIAVVKQATRKPFSGTRAQRSDLLAAALAKHGTPAIGLLDLLEADAGYLHVDARLRRLIDLDPTALANAVGLITGHLPP